MTAAAITAANGERGHGRVVVTGWGLVAPLGDSPRELYEALCAGESAVGPLPTGTFAAEVEGQLAGVQVAAIPDFDPSKELEGRNLRPLDRTSTLLVLAAQRALASAGLGPEELEGQEVGLVVGTMFCGLGTIAAFDRRALVAGPGYASPLDFANTVINAAAGQAAIWHHLRGINSTISGEAVSGLEALAYACDLIRTGRARALLAGGVEELSFESLLGFDRLGLLAAAGNGRQARPTPFGRHRNGFAPGEGAALLLLEDEESAAARGATILGRLVGTGRSFDPSLGADEERATDRSAAAIRVALADADLAPGAVQLVSASANGSRTGDRVESRALASIFDALPPILAIKAGVGESLGAAGALQTVAALEALRSGRIAPLPTPDQLDPELPLPAQRPDRLESSPAGEGTALIHSQGFGGHAASLVVSASRERTA